MQHGRIDEGSKLGLAADDVLRLAPDAVPDRIERGELRTLRIDLMHCHDCSRKFACLVDYYSTAGGRLSRAGAGQSKPPPNAPGVSSRWSGISGNQASRRPTIGEFLLAAIPRMLGPDGGKSHQHADIAGADRCGYAVGLDRRHRHPIDVAGPRPVEWLSPAPVGYRRLPGAVVRRLSGAQPLHDVRPLSSFRRGFELLDQPRDQRAGDAVDPAVDAARTRDAAAVAAPGHQPRAGPDHRAALARQHATDRHFRRPVRAGALHPGRAWRADIDPGKMPAVRPHRFRRRDAQRNARGAARTVLHQAGSRVRFCAGGFPFPD